MNCNAERGCILQSCYSVQFLFRCHNNNMVSKVEGRAEAENFFSLMYLQSNITPTGLTFNNYLWFKYLSTRWNKCLERCSSYATCTIHLSDAL